MKKTILITGATSGFGKAIALKFGQGGYRVILNGRRIERLNELKAKLEEEYGTEALALPFDVRDREAVGAALESLPAAWNEIDILVNNAGLASGLNDIQNGDLDDWDAMIDTNVKGLLYVTRAVAPLMVARNQGHIINIGSIAGKEVYPKGNVYCATKHAVDALNKAMRVDMLPHNIKVTAIHPGMAETEFSIVRFHGDEERAKGVYQGMMPLYGEDIADTAWYVTHLPAHVNINELTIMPTAQASAREVIRQNA